MNPAAIPAPRPDAVAVLPFEVNIGATRAAACLGVAHVPADAATHEPLAAFWLKPSELERYRRFQVDSARRSFLAGRLAAKSCLNQLAPDRHGATGWEIVSGTWQRPKVRGHAAGLAISLSHSDGTGIALAFDDRWIAGVDVEAVNTAGIDTIRGELSTAEVEWALSPTLDAHDARLTRWFMLWTAREAFGKLLGTGLGLPEALLPWTGWRSCGRGWMASTAGNESFGVLSSSIGPRLVASMAFPAGSISEPVQNHICTWLSVTASP